VWGAAQVHRVVALQQRVQELVHADRVAAPDSAPVAVPGQELLHCERGRSCRIWAMPSVLSQSPLATTSVRPGSRIVHACSP